MKPDTPAPDHRKPIPYSGPDLSENKPTFDPRLLLVAWGMTTLLSIEFLIPNTPTILYKVAVAAVTSNTAAAEAEEMESPEMNYTSQYLLDNGWLPSPTTYCFAAWEHPKHFVMPEQYVGLYSTDQIRVPTGRAVWIQNDWETSARDEYLQYCSVFGGP